LCLCVLCDCVSVSCVLSVSVGIEEKPVWIVQRSFKGITTLGTLPTDGLPAQRPSCRIGLTKCFLPFLATVAAVAFFVFQPIFSRFPFSLTSNSDLDGQPIRIQASMSLRRQRTARPRRTGAGSIPALRRRCK
jgi:hypothetical protein